MIETRIWVDIPDNCLRAIHKVRGDIPLETWIRRVVMIDTSRRIAGGMTTDLAHNPEGGEE